MITYGSTTLTSYNSITSTEVYYYKSSSATALSGGSWSTTKPTWENGKYIWQKIRTIYEDETYTESDPVNITGQQGATGAAAYSYKLNASDTIIGKTKTGEYTIDKITFSATFKQGTSAVTAYSGRFKIEITEDGSTWTTPYTSSANESSKEFTIPENIVAVKCSLYQAGGMTVLLDIVTIPVVKDGVDAIGLKDSIPFYLASNKETGVTIYDEGWSTTRPALDATNKYLWVYYLSRYSDGTTDPELIEVSGDIATFENNGDVSPIYSTEIDIEPIQDLNGFDHAWNGGDGKNLLAYPYYTRDTHTSNGITFTVEKYSNGAIKDVLVNGTASALTFFNFSGWGSAKTDLSKYTGQSLIISGGTNNARISIQYRLPNSTSNKTLANDAGTGATFTVPDASDLVKWAIFISISNGTVLNNVRVYPMLRLATETDGTYEPYENICPISGWNNIKIERTGKNLLGIKYPNRTNNGITFTVNGSEITANGTATANAYSSANLGGITSSLQYKNLIPPGQYMLTGGKSTDKRIYLVGNYLNGKGITIVNDYGNGALYTLTDWAYVYPQVQINNGVTVENEVFNIQLEATTTATEYEPYCGNSYEVDFPTEAGTIFKGKLIIDENGDGQLIQTHKSIILDNTNRNGYNLYSPNIRPYWIIDDKALFSSYIEANNHIYTDSCIISHSGVINSPQNAKVQALSAYTTKVVYVILINITTQEAMDAYLADHPIQLVYELAEPVIYHLTAKQILAVLKTNHIYANTGNTTVKYYDNQKVTEPYIDYSATSAFEYSAEALEKIDNLEIGGRNLFIGTSRFHGENNAFVTESNKLDNYYTYFNNGSIYTLEPFHEGEVITLQAKSNIPWNNRHATDGTGINTVGFWIQAFDTSEDAKDRKNLKRSQFLTNDLGDNNTIFKKTWTIPTSDDGKYYCFRFNSYSDGATIITAKFWDLKLEKGTKATDWSPASEDVDASISTAQSTADTAMDRATAIYGTCSTATGTAAKVVTCPNFVLFDGARIQVTFTNANTASAPTLNVNSTGAKPIYINKTVTSSSNLLLWTAGSKMEFVYDGTGWIAQNVPYALYGTCSTGASTAAKAVTCNEAVICKGTTISVNMTNTNTAANATMNVGSTLAKDIYANGVKLTTNSRFNWHANTVQKFVFDGQVWRMDDDSVKALATAYITEIDEDGIMVHPEDDSNSGWAISDAIQLFKNGISYIKLWIENNIPKIRIGKEDQGHIILDNDSVDVRNGDDILASFGETSIIGDQNQWHQTIASDKTSFANGQTEYAYISPDKFYAINAEVSDAFYISNYSIRNASDGKLIIGLRRK